MTNIKYLLDNKVHIWDEWADEDGNLGPVYGEQWVNWRGRDYDTHGRGIETVYHNQIQTIIDKLTEGHKNFNPMDRGLIVSAWNVGELDQMALRPCHAFFQFQARELSLGERIEYGWKHMEGNEMDYDLGLSNSPTEEDTIEFLNDFGVPKYELSLQLYQRSADTFLGVPFNIASYSLLLHMVCHVTNMKPGKFVHTFGDAHIYLNHKDQVNDNPGPSAECTLIAE